MLANGVLTGKYTSMHARTDAYMHAHALCRCLVLEGERVKAMFFELAGALAHRSIVGGPLVEVDVGAKGGSGLMLQSGRCLV